MTEIKLTKRYPQSRTEDIVDAYMRGWNNALDAMQNKIAFKKECDECPHAKCLYEADRNSPQTDCYVSDLCKHYGDKQVCGRCRSRNLFCEKDEPQTEETQDGFYDEYYRDHEEFYEPQTERSE